MAQEANVYCDKFNKPWKEFSSGIEFAQQINLLKC
jgi:hypothetical protein